MNRKLAILTFHRAFNVGAMLQAWALAAFAGKCGWTAEFPDCNTVGWTPRWRRVGRGEGWVLRIKVLLANLCSLGSEDLARVRFARFARLLKRSPAVALERGDYELAIIGSDQVWNVRLTRTEAAVFFGETLPAALPVCVYAASAGDEPVTPATRERILRLVARAQAASVRERIAGIELPVMADPVFLLSRDDFRLVAKRDLVRGKYVFVFMLRPDPWLMALAREIARREGWKAVMTATDQYSWVTAPRGLAYAVSPDRMLGYVDGAECVLTNTFHGAAMACVFGKRVFAVGRRGCAAPERIARLFAELGIESRLSVSGSEMAAAADQALSPLPADFDARLRALSDRSQTFVQDRILGNIRR